MSPVMEVSFKFSLGESVKIPAKAGAVGVVIANQVEKDDDGSRNKVVVEIPGQGAGWFSEAEVEAAN